MPGGYKNIKGTDGNTFTSENQPKNRGRKPSIKKQLETLLDANGTLKIDAKNVVSIEEDGSVIIQVPTQMQLAMHLQRLAMSGKNNVSLNALKLILEQFDGKAPQTINTNLDMLGPPIQGLPLIDHESLQTDKDI